MIPKKMYIVVKGSDDGTFLVGDHIRLCEDGDIMCREGGWIAAEDVPDATKGMEIEIDQEGIEARRKQLLEELEELK